jgi:hypothetical protein
MAGSNAGEPDTEAKGQRTPPDSSKAVAMLNAFASVGATVFDVSLTDIEETGKVFQPKCTIDELTHSLSRRLAAANSAQYNLIIRPRSTTALLVQLDDFDEGKAARMEPYAFMTVRTSPGNYQVWLAVADGPKESEKEAAKQFRIRVRKGAGADKSATGATRIAGSLNFKKKYAPNFPMITLSHASEGRVTTTAALEQAGLIAEALEPQPPASVPPRIGSARPAAGRRWPDYQQSLKGAPLKHDGAGPDRSLADFMWCKWAVQRGWDIEEIVAKLLEVSEKAQERARRGDEGYALLTARNATAAVERERGRQLAKSARRSG